MAERITNGGFETGDLTGWTASSGGYTASSYVAHSGTYSVSSTAGSGQYLTQDVDLTDVDTLTFWQYDDVGGGHNGYVYVDTTLVKTYVWGGSWAQESIDVSAYSGTHTIKFTQYLGASADSYIDDISAIATASGWTHITKENSITASGVTKTNGVLNTAIAKMNGVVV